MNKDSFVFVVAAALINQSGRILLAQRPAHKHIGGLWEFPGGKVDAYETPEQALIRELHEELGIAINIHDLKPLTFVSHAYEGFHLFMPLYMCHVWQGELQAIEHDDLEWVPAAELKTYPMPPADEPLINALIEYTAKL